MRYIALIIALFLSQTHVAEARHHHARHHRSHHIHAAVHSVPAIDSGSSTVVVTIDRPDFTIPKAAFPYQEVNFSERVDFPGIRVLAKSDKEDEQPKEEVVASYSKNVGQGMILVGMFILSSLFLWHLDTRLDRRIRLAKK